MGIEKMTRDERRQIGTTLQKGYTLNTQDIMSRFSSDKGFKNLLYYRGLAVPFHSNGAIGRNYPAWSDVGSQRDAKWLARRGMFENNTAILDQAILSLQYAFSMQNDDGSFVYNYPDPSQELSAGSFFLDAFSGVYYDIMSGTYASAYSSKLQPLIPLASKAMAWLGRNVVSLASSDHSVANRLLFDTCAFALTAQIAKVSDTASASFLASAKGLVQAPAQGQIIFSENGGYDSSYQCVSMLNIESLILYWNNPQAQSFIDALSKAMNWEATRIDDTGYVSTVGNTRTAGQDTDPSGAIKVVNYPEVALAIYYAAAITGNISYLAKSSAVVFFLLEGMGLPPI